MDPHRRTTASANGCTSARRRRTRSRPGRAGLDVGADPPPDQWSDHDFFVITRPGEAGADAGPGSPGCPTASRSFSPIADGARREGLYRMLICSSSPSSTRRRLPSPASTAFASCSIAADRRADARAARAYVAGSGRSPPGPGAGRRTDADGAAVARGPIPARGSALAGPGAGPERRESTWRSSRVPAVPSQNARDARHARSVAPLRKGHIAARAELDEALGETSSGGPRCACLRMAARAAPAVAEFPAQAARAVEASSKRATR